MKKTKSTNSLLPRPYLTRGLGRPYYEDMTPPLKVGMYIFIYTSAKKGYCGKVTTVWQNGDVDVGGRGSEPGCTYSARNIHYAVKAYVGCVNPVLTEMHYYRRVKV